MKTPFRALILCIVFLLTFIIFGFSVTVGRADNTISKEEVGNTGYLLREYEGRLAIFKENQSDPIKKFEVYIEELPERDIAKLKVGIKTDSFEGAMRLAEDYE